MEMMTVESVRMAAVLTGLAVNGVIDIRKKKISLIVTLMLGILGIGFRVASRNVQPMEIFFAILPGVVSLLCTVVSRGRVGCGDGLTLLALGCCIPGDGVLAIWILALCMSGFWALILCVVFHKGRNYEIPFVPFVFFGFLLWRCGMC